MTVIFREELPNFLARVGYLVEGDVDGIEKHNDLDGRVGFLRGSVIGVKGDNGAGLFVVEEREVLLGKPGDRHSL